MINWVSTFLHLLGYEIFYKLILCSFQNQRSSGTDSTHTARFSHQRLFSYDMPRPRNHVHPLSLGFVLLFTCLLVSFFCVFYWSGAWRFSTWRRCVGYAAPGYPWNAPCTWLLCRKRRCLDFPCFPTWIDPVTWVFLGVMSITHLKFYQTSYSHFFLGIRSSFTLFRWVWPYFLFPLLFYCII